jgi:hypothetical protein
MRGFSIGLAAVLAVAAPAQAASDPVIEKQRLIVLSDIEAEADDSESLIRLLIYANEIDIEGLIATTSIWLKTDPQPETMRRIVAGYGKVQPNLLRNAPGYPSPTQLLALIQSGQPGYGMASVGRGKDSAGSALLLRALERPDPRPLWVAVWGGANTLAQALYTLRATRSPAEAARLFAKLRVYTISDQDDSGAWLRREFPDLFYIVSTGPYSNGSWTGMSTPIEGIDNGVVSNDWIARNIQQGHGPLGALYPDVAWTMEGDTPSFLNLIPTGLSVPEHPEWGGWGGRYERYVPRPFPPGETVTGGIPLAPETRPIWTNADDFYTPMVPTPYSRPIASEKTFRGPMVTVWRWREAYQNDMAARIAWTTRPFAEANHPPVPRLAHADRLTVHSGEKILLDASPSTDPDGDSLSFAWFPYPEAGSWKQPVPINRPENVYRANATAPVVEKPETLHFVVAVTDKGTPALTRYRRVIVTVLPSAGSAGPGH